MQTLLTPDTDKHIEIMQRDDLPDTCCGNVQVVQHAFQKIASDTLLGCMATVLLRTLWEKCARTDANRFTAGDVQWSLDHDQQYLLSHACAWHFGGDGKSTPKGVTKKLLDMLLHHALIHEQGGVFRFDDALSARLLHAQAAWYALCRQGKAA